MENISIRLIKKEDYSRLYEIIEKNRSRLLMYFPKTSNAVRDLASAAKFVDLKLKQQERREQYYFLIDEIVSKQLIGSIILKNIDWSIPKGELAYFVDGEWEGKGVITYAVKSLVNYSFYTLGFNKLYIKINPANWGSKKAALKNGFELEGLLKGEFRTGQGELTDVERYGLLKSAH